MEQKVKDLRASVTVSGEKLDACEELELITKLTERYKDNKVVADMLFHKKVEDGILAKLHNANLYQLNMLKKDFRFRYYGKDITDKLIDIQIKKTERKNKLEKILESI